MLRQNTVPMQYDQTMRPMSGQIVTSGRAGVVTPLSMIALHRGESAAGDLTFDFMLAEMPKPILNAVQVRVQAWFVPRTALPHFSGVDEYLFSYHGHSIRALGAADRTPPDLFLTETGATPLATLNSSALITSLGYHIAANTPVNLDYIDSFNLVYNFRSQAMSKNLPYRPYYSEDAAASVTLPPAFWPSAVLQGVVPDYESALVKGALDLDVSAGQVPVTTDVAAGTAVAVKSTVTSDNRDLNANTIQLTVGGAAALPDANVLYTDLIGQTITTSLADIDKARTTKTFAKYRSSYAGADPSGFRVDDVIIGELMQGFQVPKELYARPWLLDSKVATFGLSERHATDAANLDDSVTTGDAYTRLSINVPRQEHGGVIVVTAEVFPERMSERGSDEYMHVTSRSDLPEPLRDLQRTEPVDPVLNRRLDAAHASPGGQYGHEPMNNKWRSPDFLRMGGKYRQTTPGTPITTSRFAIWHPDVVDPSFNSDHYLCPSPFPHTVFSFSSEDCWDVSARQNIALIGRTVQYGEDLAEDNGEFADTKAGI